MVRESLPEEVTEELKSESGKEIQRARGRETERGRASRNETRSGANVPGGLGRSLRQQGRERAWMPVEYIRVYLSQCDWVFWLERWGAVE